MERSPSRRTVLRSTALAGVAATAGCLGSAAAPSDEEPPEQSLEEWLATTNVGAAEFRDRRFSDSVAVHVGMHGQYSFAPAAIRVTPGTTVTWTWPDDGGAHNVVATDGSFDSGEPVEGRTRSFEHTFEATGTHRYVCEPHREQGMKGVVAVEEAPSTGYREVDRWLVDADGFDGSLPDRTGRETVTVTVGAAGNGGEFAFDPLAATVSTGTTVRWKWTGNGGAHNVVFGGADIGSGEVVSESGVHFEHTFEDAGIYRYYCAPHRALGMKGALVVE
jgi:halocyanin-like protein